MAGTQKAKAGKTRVLPGVYGGAKRQRSSSGGMRPLHQPPRMLPDFSGQAMGYEFPRKRATPNQMQRLRRLVIDYLRKSVAVQTDFSSELLGEAFGLKERQAQTVVGKARQEARRMGGGHNTWLVKSVLLGMHTRKIAGVLGTPHTTDTRHLFRLISELVSDLERLLHWMPSTDQAAMRMWAAAFQVDYHEWLRQE